MPRLGQDRKMTRAEAQRMTQNESGAIVADAAIVVHRERGPGLHEAVIELCERPRIVSSSLRLCACLMVELLQTSRSAARGLSRTSPALVAGMFHEGRMRCRSALSACICGLVDVRVCADRTQVVLLIAIRAVPSNIGFPCRHVSFVALRLPSPKNSTKMSSRNATGVPCSSGTRLRRFHTRIIRRAAASRIVGYTSSNDATAGHAAWLRKKRRPAQAMRGFPQSDASPWSTVPMAAKRFSQVAGEDNRVLSCSPCLRKCARKVQLQVIQVQTA